MAEAGPRLCEACGSGGFRRLPYYYTLGEKRIYGVRCTGCGLVTVSPMPAKDELAALYSEEYFKSDYHCGHREGSYEEEESFSAEHDRILAAFRRLKPSGRMLEVGSAGGRFLLGAMRLGYDVMGVELSADACRIAGRLGVPHYCGELSGAGFPDESFDLAYLGDVLEHMPEPLADLAELRRVLSPGGVVGISCPTNIGLLSSRLGLLAYSLMGRERRAPIPPYHLYEFRPGDIKRLLGRAGFAVVRTDVDIIPPWRINLRGSAMEKLMKAALHWPNYLLTKLTGLCGDRVTIFAAKPGGGGR